MLKVLYWIFLLTSIVFGIGAIGAMIDLLKQGDISIAAVEPIFIIPAVLLIFKKKTIYKWIAKSSSKPSATVINNEHISVVQTKSFVDRRGNDKNDYSEKPKRPERQIHTASRVIKIRSSKIRYVNFIFRILFFVLSFLLEAFETASRGYAKEKRESTRKALKRPGNVTLITPWILEIDIGKSVIHLKKRNWFLIGLDKQDFKYKQIRDIHVNEHIFTADVHIRFYAGYFAGKVSAYYFSKGQAAMFRNTLLPLIENPDS
ncbi:MAG: hypothetical protein ACYDCJ_13740 [Gammaproteobacteria bacterium]